MSVLDAIGGPDGRNWGPLALAATLGVGGAAALGGKYLRGLRAAGAVGEGAGGALASAFRGYGHNVTSAATPAAAAPTLSSAEVARAIANTPPAVVDIQWNPDFRRYALTPPGTRGGELYSTRAAAVRSARERGWQVAPLKRSLESDLEHWMVGWDSSRLTERGDLMARQRLHDATNAEEARLLALDPDTNPSGEPLRFMGVKDLVNWSLQDARAGGDGRILREMLAGELGPFGVGQKYEHLPLPAIAAGGAFGGGVLGALQQRRAA